MNILHFIRVMAWNATHNPDFQTINFIEGLEFGIFRYDGLKCFSLTIPLNYSGWFSNLEWQYEKTKSLDYKARLEWFNGPPF